MITEYTLTHIHSYIIDTVLDAKQRGENVVQFDTCFIGYVLELPTTLVVKDEIRCNGVRIEFTSTSVPMFETS